MDDTEGEEVKEGMCYIHVDFFLVRSSYVTSVSDTLVPFSFILKCQTRNSGRRSRNARYVIGTGISLASSTAAMLKKHTTT